MLHSWVTVKYVAETSELQPTMIQVDKQTPPGYLVWNFKVLVWPDACIIQVYPVWYSHGCRFLSHYKNLHNTVKSPLTDYCCERPPVLKDHLCLTEGPIFERSLTWHKRRLALETIFYHQQRWSFKTGYIYCSTAHITGDPLSFRS